MNVREQYDQTIAKARDLATKAAGRDFTPEEMAAATELQRQAAELEPHAKQHDADQATKAFIANLGVSIGHDTTVAAPGGDGQPLAKDGGASVKKTEPNRTPWAKASMQRIGKIQQAGGGKALVSGSIDVPDPIFGADGIVPIATYPTRVLDLLVDRVGLTRSNTFNYIRQTTRTNNAGFVADAATKPTSVFTVEDVEGRVRVLAHLSQPIPERILADHGELGDFLEVEMERGLLEVLEEQVVSGDGTGENLTGITATSGTIVQTYAGSIPVTLRKARTTMSIVGENPTAWLLNPADTEAIDLLREGADGGFLLATPPGNITGNLPIVESTAIPAGTALLADWRWARLVVREDSKLDIDRSGTLFTSNQLIMRLEGRYGFAVRRTTAFCEVALTV